MATDYFELMRLMAGEEHGEIARLGHDWKQVRQLFRDADTTGDPAGFNDLQMAAFCWKEEWHWIQDWEDGHFYYENCVEL